MKDIKWWKFTSDEIYLVVKVKIVQEVKMSDGLWRFACGDVLYKSIFYHFSVRLKNLTPLTKDKLPEQHPINKLQHLVISDFRNITVWPIVVQVMGGIWQCAVWSQSSNHPALPPLWRCPHLCQKACPHAPAPQCVLLGGVPTAGLLLGLPLAAAAKTLDFLAKPTLLLQLRT